MVVDPPQRSPKVAVGVVSHRTLQVDRPEDVAARIRAKAGIEHVQVVSDVGNPALTSGAVAVASSRPVMRNAPSPTMPTTCASGRASFAPIVAGTQ